MHTHTPLAARQQIRPRASGSCLGAPTGFCVRLWGRVSLLPHSVALVFHSLYQSFIFHLRFNSNPYPPCAPTARHNVIEVQLKYSYHKSQLRISFAGTLLTFVKYMGMYEKHKPPQTKPHSEPVAEGDGQRAFYLEASYTRSTPAPFRRSSNSCVRRAGLLQSLQAV